MVNKYLEVKVGREFFFLGEGGGESHIGDLERGGGTKKLIEDISLTWGCLEKIGLYWGRGDYL